MGITRSRDQHLELIIGIAIIRSRRKLIIDLRYPQLSCIPSQHGKSVEDIKENVKAGLKKCFLTIKKEFVLFVTIVSYYSVVY